MGKKFNQKSLVEHIVEMLEEEIIVQKLQPGQRIVEADICKRWNVSRSPVREAFRILESNGFLTHKPRCGTFVTQLTHQEAEEIYIIRANLESLAISLAALKHDENDLKVLKNLHERMLQAATKGLMSDIHRLNLKFHENLIEASKSPRLITLCKNLEKQIKPYRAAVTVTRGMESSIQSHAKIIKLIEIRNSKMAEKERKQRILSSIPILKQYLKDKELTDVVSPG